MFLVFNNLKLSNFQAHWIRITHRVNTERKVRNNQTTENLSRRVRRVSLTFTTEQQFIETKVTKNAIKFLINFSTIQAQLSFSTVFAHVPGPVHCLL